MKHHPGQTIIQADMLSDMPRSLAGEHGGAPITDALRFRLPLYANGSYRAARFLRELEMAGRFSQEELDRYVRSSRHRLLDHAAANVPFYRNALAVLPDTARLSADDDLWRRIPLVDRDVIRPDEPAFISVTHGKRDWNDTSGSTGRKFRFLKDPCQRLWALASTAFVRREITGRLCPRELTVWGAPRDSTAGSGLLSKLKLRFTLKRVVIAYQLDAPRIRGILESVAACRPMLLSGYPNIISLLCENDASGILRTPAAILSAGEWLRPDLRRRIESHTRRRIFDFYGCRELGSIAYECREHRGLHILSPLVHVESLKEDGSPCTAGEPGELVITSLVRRSMPLIRYRIGDMGVLTGETCSCGSPFPLLAEVCGRTMDTVTLSDGRRIAGYFWTHLAREVEGVSQFRIVQNRGITMEVVPETGMDPVAVKSSLEKELAKNGVRGETEIVFVDRLPVNQSGKTGLVVSGRRAEQDRP